MATPKKSAQPSRMLYRSETNKVLGGVAGGIADYFEVDPNLVRFLFILITLLGGSGILLYLILWILLPSEKSKNGSQQETVRDNIKEMKSVVRNVADEIKSQVPERHRRRTSSGEWFAFVLILIGALFLLQNFGLLWWFSMEKLWPVILILLGIGILLRHNE